MSQEHGTGSQLDRRGVLQRLATTSEDVDDSEPTGGIQWQPLLQGLTGDCFVEDWPEPMDEILYLGDFDREIERGEFPEDGELIIFIHGLAGAEPAEGFNGARQAAAFKQALRDQGVDLPVVAGMWDSLVDPVEPSAAATNFADWLEDDEDGIANYAKYSPLHVFGHSMGGVVTAETLLELQTRESDAGIESVGLLGAAIPPSDICTVYHDPIEDYVLDGVYNYHTREDLLVCDMAEPGIGNTGTGCDGADCEDTDATIPEKYTDIDQSDDVWGHCNYFKPEEGMEYRWESGISDIVENQF